MAQAAEKYATQDKKAGGPQVIQAAHPQKVRHDGIPKQHDNQAEENEKREYAQKYSEAVSVYVSQHSDPFQCVPCVLPPAGRKFLTGARPAGDSYYL
jgi:hypothetical protein